jgi:phosphate:Na+ symporter
MPWLQIIGPLVGGLALFLFGLGMMTGALKTIAGSRLQTALGALTANRFRGVIAGAGVTGLLNSSTITTVLMVGFVSAGLMNLDQAVPMIMGANVGSTVTAQIVAFNVAAIVPFMLAIGFLLETTSVKELPRQLGRALMGLGLLFLGIEFMGDATRPLRSFQPFISAMQDMRNPLIGIAIGAVFTAIVQSSAATLAIVIALGSQGLIPLEAGIALILGANVGTCGTALLAAIGKPAEALQVALVHLMFNTLGVLFFVFWIPQFADLVRHVSPSSPELEGAARLAAETPRQAANAHTIFSVGATLVLIWFTKPMARLAQRLAPSKASQAEISLGVPKYLDETTLDVPAFAIGRIQLELMRMGEYVIDLVKRSTNLALGEKQATVSELEKEAIGLDELAAAILSFIGQVSDTDHSEKEGQQLVDLTQVTAGLDGIRELAAANLLPIHERRRASETELSGIHSAEVKSLQEVVMNCLERAVAIIETSDQQVAQQILDAKREIEGLSAAARQGMMGGVDLNNSRNVQSFRLANGLLEYFNEIARRTRAVARATTCLSPVAQIDTTEDQEPATK